MRAIAHHARTLHPMTRFMREQGYVVLRAVANASELAHARELLWAFLEVTSGP